MVEYRFCEVANVRLGSIWPNDYEPEFFEQIDRAVDLSHAGIHFAIIADVEQRARVLVRRAVILRHELCRLIVCERF